VPDAFRTFAFALAILGVISIVYGAFVALGQTDFKKMVAYSSVSHMGLRAAGLRGPDRVGHERRRAADVQPTARPRLPCSSSWA